MEIVPKNYVNSVQHTASSESFQVYLRSIYSGQGPDVAKHVSFGRHKDRKYFSGQFIINFSNKSDNK
jgi:hypothetical protein